jgi:hypothetical protein
MLLKGQSWYSKNFGPTDERILTLLATENRRRTALQF